MNVHEFDKAFAKMSSAKFYVKLNFALYSIIRMHTVLYVLM